MTTPDAPPTGLLTVAEAADRLGVSPWEVMRLTESGRLPCVVYVPSQAVAEHQETHQ